MVGFDNTVTYGLSVLLTIGGLMGFIQSGSTTSLIAGFTSGTILAYASYLISRPRQKEFGYKLAIGVCVFLTLLMGYRYSLSGKFMPAGMVAILSCFVGITNYVQLGKQSTITQ